LILDRAFTLGNFQLGCRPALESGSNLNPAKKLYASGWTIPERLTLQPLIDNLLNIFMRPLPLTECGKTHFYSLLKKVQI
jgi:hypothetical protein